LSCHSLVGSFKIEFFFFYYSKLSLWSIVKKLWVLADGGVAMPDSVYRHLEMAVELCQAEARHLVQTNDRFRLKEDNNDGHHWITDKLLMLQAAFK
jgi:hypothetical protein